MRRRNILLGLLLLTVVGVAFAALYLATRPTTERITVMGTLKQGVEAGCTILEADNGQVYTLVDMPTYRCGGSDTSLDIGKIALCLPPYGSRVKVTGFIEKNGVSYCMQGPLLHVEDMTVLK